MSAITSAPHVVIAGAGSGGLAAASLLREAGAIVTVLERVVDGAPNPARNAGIVLGRESWDIFRKVGGGSLLDDALSFVDDRSRLMARSSMDDLVGGNAESLGATIRRGVEVREFVDHGDRVSIAVRDAVRGTEELLEADYFINATGHELPGSAAEAFRRIEQQGPMKLLPSRQRFAAVQAAAVPDRPAGWTAPDGSFAINNRATGVLTAYRDVSGTDDAIDAAELLRGLDVDPATKHGDAFSFPVRQSLAESAARGRVLLVGDSVGTVLPVTQMGASLALLDAERAAGAIVNAHRAADAAEAAAIISTYGAQTRMMHQAFIR